jgi:drug/metabolite transporter (DMT)-like permease
MTRAYSRQVPRLSQTRAYGALLLMAALWGTFPTTAKLALEDLSPVLITSLRGVIASAFLAWQLSRSAADTTRAITPATVRSLAVLGLLGIAGSTQLSYLAIATTTAANAALLQATAPAMVAVAARLFLGERLRGQQWLGLAVSAFGTLLVITDGRLANLAPAHLRVGDFLVIVSIATWSGFTIYGKRVLADVSPALATTGAYVFGTAVTIVVALVTAPLFAPPRLASPVAWLVVVYHAIPGAIAHVWWYRAVERVGPSRAAIFQNVTPVVGVVLATTLLHEVIDAWVVAGGLLVLVGVALTTRVSPARS